MARGGCAWMFAAYRAPRDGPNAPSSNQLMGARASLRWSRLTFRTRPCRQLCPKGGTSYESGIPGREVVMDAFQQFFHPKRLEQKIVRTRFQAPEQRFRVVAGRQKNDRCRDGARVRPEPLRQADAVEPRHENVREQQVRRFTLRCLPRLLAVGGDFQLVTGTQQFAEKDAGRSFILRQQEARLRVRAWTARDEGGGIVHAEKEKWRGETENGRAVLFSAPTLVRRNAT